MKEELKCTNNTLADIIRFLKEGNIVCIHYGQYGDYYNSKSKCIKINDEKLIYINVESRPSLLNEDELPWYIKSEGFVKYESTDILPINEKVYHFII